MIEFQKRLRAVAVMLVLALASVFAGGSTLAHAQFIPDRCPEPCEIGGNHVSEDYQRLTTPFHIRNGTSGDYLMADEYSVSAQPLVQNDDRFLWVLLPGPDLRNANDEVSEIIYGNGFEKKFYKLINLKYSRALMTNRVFNLPVARATHLGDKQFWLFRKDPRDRTNSKYLLYNPKVEVPEDLRFTYHLDRTEVVASMASKATMPALMQARGRDLQVRTGAGFGAAGFTWNFEEAPKPEDLARLTIKSVKALQVSTGKDANTDKLVDGIKFAVEYGPMLAQPALAASKAAKKFTQAAVKAGQKVAKAAAKAGQKAAKVAAKAATEIAQKIQKKLADRAAKTAAKGVKRGFGETLKAGAKAAKAKAGKMADALLTKARSLFTKNASAVVSEKVVKESLRRRLVKGAYTVGAASYRGMSWLAKKTGSAATKGGKTVIKLGRTAGRKTNEVAKKGYAKLKKLTDAGVEKAIKLAKEKRKKLVKFLNDPEKVDDYLAKKLLKQSRTQFEKWGAPVIRTFLKPANTPDKIYANNFNDLPPELQALRQGIPKGYEKEILALPRLATYDDGIAISAEEYLVCSDTKTYAVPQENPPYYRIGSSQNLDAVSQGAKTLFETFEGTDSDEAAKAGGMTALNFALDPVTTLINDIMIEEILRASDDVDDDLQIRINNRSVWPNGGGNDHRSIGSGHAPLNVGVEYLFRRGDDITINLIEWDKGGPVASGDDSLGDLTIPTHHLFDIEEYKGAYIQKTSEGSLYQIDFVIEPLYAPTPTERVRKKLHDVECEGVLAQARAEEFAEEVETVRIEGRSAMVREFDNGTRKTDAKAHLRSFEHTVGWANDQSCPISSNYAEILNGEWRVGKFNEFGEKDRSITWTNTFNDSDQGQSSDWGIGGDIVTPSQNGKWRTDSLSSSRHVTKNIPTEYDVQTRDGLEIGTQWKSTYLGIQESFIDVKDTDDTCEIYAAMYDRHGVLGGVGSSRKSEQVRSGKNNVTIYDTIGSETAIAMRGNLSGSKFDGTLYQIADEKNITHQAVSFLKDYYEYMPEKKAGVNANLHLASSGPAEFWYEKINVEESTRSGQNSQEASTIIEKVKASITGSWEVAPYSQNEVAPQSPLLQQTPLKENPKFPKKAEAKQKTIWTFTDDGVFIEKPEYDFWFKPSIYGTWKYIGDQRIEVRTNIPIKIPANAERVPGDKTDTRANIGPNVGLNLNTGWTGDNSGVRFIVKMAQKLNNPTEFSGFYVQDSSGKKAIWSTPYHPGKSPYEVPELYSDAFFDLLDSKSLNNKAPAAYLQQLEAERKANKAGMAAKLAALEALRGQSVCNMDSYTAKNGEVTRPGDSAFSGKWRVGQYDARGEKKYSWNYVNGSSFIVSPNQVFKSDADRRAAINANEQLRQFRPEDTTVMDDQLGAFTWITKYLEDGEYQQEWTFPERNGSVTIRSRFGNFNGGAKYLKGDVAPPDASWSDVVYDQGKGTFVMKEDSSYIPSYPRETFDLSWSSEGCKGGTLTLTDDFEKYLGSNKYPVNFIYHPNGDKEFYITKEDGTLYLWGLKDADKSKYTYKYGNQPRTARQVADECTTPLGKRYSEEDFPYDYADKNMDLSGKLVIQNNGLTPLRVLKTDKRSGKYYSRMTIKPGGYGSFEAVSDQKIAILHSKEEYNALNYKDACVGSIRAADLWPSPYFKIGEGFVAPAKHTSALDARVYCRATYIRPEKYAGHPAVVDFKNNTAKPLEIFRLGRNGEKISPSGSARKIPPSGDPRDSSYRYYGLRTIATVQPGETHKLRTMVGHTFTAITRGTERYVKEYDQKRGKQVERSIGDGEQCYGRIKVSEALETIDLRDGVPQDQIDDAYYKFSAPRRKEIAEYNAWLEKRSKDGEKAREDLRIANNLGLVLDIDPAVNTVAENASVGTPVGLMAVAIDGDKTDTVSYVVISKNFSLDVNGKNVRASHFDINADTGEVVVKHPLDFEKGASHTVIVLATSSDGAESSGKFVVSVEDVNEFDITQAGFSLEDLRFDNGDDDTTPTIRKLIDIPINENAWMGKHIVWAYAEDKDILDSVTYSLSDDAGGLFEIDPVSGSVMVSGILDYESGSIHSITAVATSTDGTKSSVTTEVAIRNVNEGPVGDVRDVDPTPNEVKENAPVGTTIGVTVGALEPDFRSDKVTLTLEPWCEDCPNYYEVDPESGIIKTTSAFAADLEDTSPEAYEKRLSAQIFYVRAKSSDGSYSKEQIRVKILDVNEFKIEKAKDVDFANNTVAEDAIVGTPVGITAQARDEDVSASVRYWLANGSANGRFQIDIDTGVVTVKGPLKYNEFDQSPSITVLSQSSDLSTSQQVFNIRITDVDKYAVGPITDTDHAPNTTYERDYDLLLTNNSGYTGITVFATDEDANSVIQYSIKGDNTYVYNPNFRRGHRSYGDGVSIDVISGQVFVPRADFETTPSLDFVVVATSRDASQSGETTSEAEFYVTVKNINDNPVWPPEDVDATPNVVSERAKFGTSVGITAAAKDGDEGTTITYELGAGSDRGFLIESEAGVVIVGRTPPDAERANGNASVNVVARSSDGSTAEKVFDIKVMDINEFYVVWHETSETKSSVREDAAIGDAVSLNLFAFDRDISDTVTYSLVNSEDIPFAINSQTGVVTVSRSLREPYLDNYSLDILATSTDGTQDTLSVIVLVEGLNDFSVSDLVDNDPTINAVDENSRRGTPVGIAAFASDDDLSDTITYSLTNYDLPFSIDSKTGVISVNNDVDYEEAASYNIEVSASSSDGSFARASFVVDVNDINEHDLSFFRDLDQADNAVDENTPRGTTVGITAFARDYDGTAIVTYHLVDDADGRFVIDTITGVVSVARELDYEASSVSEFSIEIIANSSDGSLSPPSIGGWVDLLDINEFDISAVVDVNDAANEVDELATENTEIGVTAFAEDADGTNSVAYSIVDNNDDIIVSSDAAFGIDGNGVVFVSNPLQLDAGGTGSTVVRVRATSSDGSTSVEGFPVTILLAAKWYENPQGPRVGADYPTVSDADVNICTAYDENRSLPAIYNNENAFFDCIEAALRAVPTWRLDPMGPRTDDYPNVSDEDRDICSADDQNINSINFNNENAYFDCMDSKVAVFVSWYANPQWPNILEEFPQLTSSQVDACYAANENEAFTAAFNNEEEFVACLRSYPPAPEPQAPVAKWRDNPQGPRYEENYAAVSQEAINYCRYHDEEPTSATYNNENAYFDCLTPYLPAATPANDNPTNDVVTDPVTPSIVLWRDNPQGPRYEENYAAVSQEAIDYCRYYDEEPTSATYNNENAYFDCLTPYLPAATPTNDNRSNDNPTNDVVNDPVQQPASPPVVQIVNDAPLCARQYGFKAEYSDKMGTLTLINNSDDYVEVHHVNADGTSSKLMDLEFGQSTEITTPLRLVHVGFDPAGNCIGARKLRESQGNITFGD